MSLCFLHQAYDLIQCFLCSYVQCLKLGTMATLKVSFPSEHSDGI